MIIPQSWMMTGSHKSRAKDFRIMTIALAFAAKGAGIVASDGIRVESDCSVRLDWDKTFGIGGWLLGPHAGLLEFSEKPTPTHICDAIGNQPCSMEECIAK